MKFIVITCAELLARHNPANTSANPASMNTTKNPVISAQSILVAILLCATFWINSSVVGWAYTPASGLFTARFSKVFAGTGHCKSCSSPALAPGGTPTESGFSADTTAAFSPAARPQTAPRIGVKKMAPSTSSIQNLLCAFTSFIFNEQLFLLHRFSAAARCQQKKPS